MINKDVDLRKYIKSDLFRLGKGISKKTFYNAYRTNKTFRFLVWFRLARHYNILNKKRSNFVLSVITKIIYKKLSIKYSIDFPLTVNLGYGLKINHGIALVVNSKSIIGNNVMLAHSVTLASEKNGVPIIGDKVRISPGVVVVGAVHIGDNVVIGANALVNKSVPENSVAVGVPNRNILKKFDEFTDRFYYENF
ncbi:serine O-acetyltransferase [uncultured Maribacter sp.]|uniref:serine O-acetyltransferase n=1 Tax=uncultured Maribacter sp. TaxID=431308 RepID=UPI00261954A8|nr:serine acetyltransferase [uncultured Maribacter sp.]